MSVKLSTLQPFEGDDADTLIRWLQAMTRRGLYGPNAGRTRVTALQQLLSVLDEDEPRDCTTLLERCDALAERWALRNDVRPATIHSYRRRARAALDEFAQFRADPNGFRARQEKRERKRRRESQRLGSAREASVKPPRRAEENAPLATGSTPKLEHHYPLDGDRDFRFALPRELTLKDVRRIAAHLETYATDFEPPSSELPRQACADAATPSERAKGLVFAALKSLSEEDLRVQEVFPSDL